MRKNKASTKRRQKSKRTDTKQYSDIKNRIDDLINQIKNDVIQCDPLHLLPYLQIGAVLSKANITSECQQLNDDDFACQRALEYVQSIYISCGKEKITDNNDQSFYYSILVRIKELYPLVYSYISEMTKKYQNEHEYDERMIDEIEEAQLMYGVRGKRYMVMEKDYYSSLLTIHDSLFRELYGMSSNDIVDGIIKLQYALTQGKLDSIKRVYDSVENYSKEKHISVEEIMEQKQEDIIDQTLQVMDYQLNDVCMITLWNEEFVRDLSFSLGEDPGFFAVEEYAGWPIIDLPIQKRPFIEVNGQYYCFDYFSFIDNFYRAIQKMIARVKKDYQWSLYQKIASEETVSNIFCKLLPDCTIYQNNYYPVHNSLKQMNENDLIVIYNDVLFIVEVKAGSFVYTAPIMDFDHHIKSYRKLIQEPNNQCERTYEYIKGNTSAKLYNEDKTEKALINFSSIKDIYSFSVTIDNINTVAARAEKVSFIYSPANTVSIALDDLMVYKQYFDSPLIFLHYIKHRFLMTKNKKIALNDELDHLGMYIENNWYSLLIDTKVQYIQFMGYRERLDTYYGQLYQEESNAKKPEQKMPQIYKDILNLLESSKKTNKRRISNYLLDFSEDDRDRFAESVEQIYERQRQTGVRNIINTAGLEENVIRYTCFIMQPEVDDISYHERLKYALTSLVWSGEHDRKLISLYFNENKELINMEFDELTEKSLSGFDRDELIRIAEKKAKERIMRYMLEHGNKIGRNEPCPCESGKKYKKCCESRNWRL